MEYYLGIDVGTTNIKAAAYTLDGKQSAFFSNSATIHKPRADWDEFDAEEIWSCVCECLGQIAKAVDPSRIRSIGISSMAESGVPADQNGNPLYPIIAWYDQRSQPQAKQLDEMVGRRKLHTITGQIPSGKYGVCKLMWIRQNHPEVYDRMAYWLSVEDFIIHRLTGKFATDYSVASRTMLFDITNLCWSDTLLKALDIPKKFFCAAYPGGTAIGSVTPRASEQTGLSTKTVIVTGGHDHACAAIGVDILQDGVLLDSMGTAECSMIAMEKPMLNDYSFANYSSIYPHCGKKMYRALSSIQSCGATIQWYFDTIGRDVQIQSENLGEDKYLIMENSAAVSKRDGLYFMPFLRGSVEDGKMRGAFIGLKDFHVAGDMARAIMDSLCYEISKHIEFYENTISQRLDTIRAVGGLACSDYFMQTKADLTGRIVEIPVHTESACFGAAILGAIGSGSMDFSGISSLYKRERIHKPAEDSDVVMADFTRYQHLRELMKETYRKYY